MKCKCGNLHKQWIIALVCSLGLFQSYSCVLPRNLHTQPKLMIDDAMKMDSKDA
ncbi:hypothetical protein HanXRQr2_Chr10g0433691 [Helianthus annuus]|uniref:Uncharacterized protein n=1 Tax=Helianthus annuus TaxID=4232 RepID=A0A9K3N3W7_HELAN|nr:hypothetical protein HanXRQr2_Chr10g0433691 [Helianthus annuus]